MKTLLPLAAALLLLASCRSDQEATREEPRRPTEEEVASRAKAAALAAFEKLSAELGKAMAEGGPTHAIPVCSSKAGSLTATVAAEHGVEMVRLSHRPRNPDQRAEGEDLAVLETLKETRKPHLSWNEDNSAVVRLPIVLSNPICLQCHGGDGDITPTTREALAELYPEDEATGFALGELRGMWRIKVPAPTN